MNEKKKETTGDVGGKGRLNYFGARKNTIIKNVFFWRRKGQTRLKKIYRLCTVFSFFVSTKRFEWC